LQASQSGLEAAKQSLDEHTKAARSIREQTPNLDDGKATNLWGLNGSTSLHPNLAWVRTAAQAAMALQLHGVLETTGLPSASARLQHASLPNFNTSRNTAWADDDGDNVGRKDSDESFEKTLEESFEEGVLHVEDGLNLISDSIAVHDDGNGYDLLPLPVPAPERQILSVGEANARIESKKEIRFRYGERPAETLFVAKRSEEDQRVYLGEMSIDENIDKLRDVIGHVDNTLSRCLASGGGIEQARRDCQSLHLRILSGLDSWEGLSGKFVSQRALLKGVTGIEQSREVFEESDLSLIDGEHLFPRSDHSVLFCEKELIVFVFVSSDMSWQTALAHSAVSAAEAVRSTVRAARTAANAKAAATSAAEVAQASCEEGKFASLDDARAAQTRASIAQSHAIHAAVVEHEAKTAKRRATLALAHDVKCWNIHRKREVLQVALSYAKSQHEATRRAVDAWTCLRDGFVGSNIILSTHTRRVSRRHQLHETATDLLTEEPEAHATIYSDTPYECLSKTRTIVAVDHELLKLPDSPSLSDAECAGEVNATSLADEADTMLPLVVADPIPEGNENAFNSRSLDSFGIGSNTATSPSFEYGACLSAHDPSMPMEASTVSRYASVETPQRDPFDSKCQDLGVDEAMTSSMQSLVNGLMTWGGEDADVDFTLPVGMAASIAMEESGVFGNKSASNSFSYYQS
jgi:hypothetical protein